MTVPNVLAIVALILAVVEVVRSRGQSLLAWAVGLVALALVWGVLIK